MNCDLTSTENSDLSQSSRVESSLVPGALLEATLGQETQASAAALAESIYAMFCLFSISLQLRQHKCSSLSFTAETYFQEG